MDREKLIEKVAEVLAGFPQVVLAYLFGSFLRGEKFNDLDLGLVLDETLCEQDQWSCVLAVGREMEKALRYQVPVDVRLLNEAPVRFQHRVIASGRLIFARSEAERIRYEKRTLLDYLDFKEMDDFFDKKLLEAILVERGGTDGPPGRNAPGTG